jgi:hypothetical protein
MTDKDNNDADLWLLAPQALVGLMDALSYMVTAPSIVFYVLQVSGQAGDGVNIRDCESLMSLQWQQQKQ